jgi:hypothetical protein
MAPPAPGRLTTTMLALLARYFAMYWAIRRAMMSVPPPAP